MSRLNGVAELLAHVDRCLAEEDWDRLADLDTPMASGPIDAGEDQIRETLTQVQSMQRRLQERLDAIKGELESVPAVLAAAKAYLTH